MLSDVYNVNGVNAYSCVYKDIATFHKDIQSGQSISLSIQILMNIIKIYSRNICKKYKERKVNKGKRKKKERKKKEKKERKNIISISIIHIFK